MRLFLLFLAALPLLAPAQSTHLVKDLNPGAPSAFDDLGLQSGVLASLDSVVIFFASGKGGTRLICRSDASDIGTTSILPALESTDLLGDYVVSGGRFWFIINRAAQADLYSTEGTWGTTKLRHSVPAARFSTLRAFGDGVVFHTKVDPFDHFLTRFSHADNAATTLGQFNWFSGILDLAVVGNTIYGIGCADNNSADRYFFSASGTAGSVQPLLLLNTGNEFNTNAYMTPVGSRVFFFFKKNGEARRLWVSDGTAAGTVSLKSMDISTGGLNKIFPPRFVGAYNGKFVCRASSIEQASTGTELWISDGTAAGTTLVKDLASGPDSSMPDNFTIYHGKLYLTTKNSAGNTVLWSTDGTSANTQRVLLDFAWNEGHGDGLCVFSDSLAFGAYESSTGAEIMLCKEAESTLKVASNVSNAGQFSFFPDNLVAAGKRLFFVATKAPNGRELWVYEPYKKATSAAQQPDFQANLPISPNPGRDVLRLDLPDGEAGLLRVFSPDGRLFLQKEISGNTALPTADWPQGTFFLQFLGEKTARSGRWTRAL